MNRLKCAGLSVVAALATLRRPSRSGSGGGWLVSKIRALLVLTLTLALVAVASPAQAHTSSASGGVGGQFSGNCVRGDTSLSHTRDTSYGSNLYVSISTQALHRLGPYLPCAIADPAYGGGQIRVKGTLSWWNRATSKWEYCTSMGGWKYNDGQYFSGKYSVSYSRTYDVPPCGSYRKYRLRTYHQVQSGTAWVGGRLPDREHTYGVFVGQG